MDEELELLELDELLDKLDELLIHAYRHHRHRRFVSSYSWSRGRAFFRGEIVRVEGGRVRLRISAADRREKSRGHGIQF